MRSFAMGLLKKVWIPLLLVVVLAVSGLVVSRLHTKFGSENLNAHAGAGIEIVQFNPKVLVYEVYGPPGSSAEISYFDPDANVHSVSAPLPWSRIARPGTGWVSLQVPLTWLATNGVLPKIAPL